LLAAADDWTTSERVAASIGTTAAHVRQLLARLAEVGLLETREGRAGGYRLARRPDAIALSEVYRVFDDGVLAPSPCTPGAQCSVGVGMPRAFDELAARTHDAVVATLGQETIADVARRALRVSRMPPPPGFHRV
ncbi:MAG: Rrf2 family transcriptional regulator, partial [Myxococcales bacterium]